MRMGFSHIKFELVDHVARLTLNRPEVLNAFNVAMQGEIFEAFQSLMDQDHVKCLVITGAGRAFCTGQDLEERRVPDGAAMPDLGESLKQRYNPIITQIKAFDFPVICAVNGAAVGGGAGFALACDIVVAAKSASFLLPFNKLGLIPDAGSTWSLPRALGLPRAKAAVLLSEKIPAPLAEEWGMIWKCVEDDQLAQTVEGYVQQILPQPRTGMALSKKAFSMSLQNSLEEQLLLESHYQSEAGANPEYRDRVMAFLNRKKS